MQLESEFSVPRESLDKLRQYEALLVKWQKAINLVGPATIPDAWERHFIDSLQLTPLIPAAAKTLYDLGSGAGFPGLVLAMARPELSVTMIESDERKGAFLSAVSHETKTPVTVLSARIERAVADLPAPDIVTARALAALNLLLAYIEPCLTCIFPKGLLAADELVSARKDWTFKVDQVASMTDPKATILILTKIESKKI